LSSDKSEGAGQARMRIELRRGALKLLRLGAWRAFPEESAQHANLFVNQRASRMDVLPHDGFGLWLCVEGHFGHAGVIQNRGVTLAHEQALEAGSGWGRLDERTKIRVR